MKIVPMTPQAARQLWRAGFAEDTDAFFSAYWTMRSDQARARMLTLDDTACAGLHVTPLCVYVRGAKIPAAMIAGVATRPDMRRRGFAGRLLRHAAASLLKDGFELAVLDPFRESFYEPFGYRTGTFYRDCIVHCGAAQPLEEMTDASVAAGIYQAALPQYSGIVVRSAQDWAFRLRDAALEDARVYCLGQRAYAIAKREDGLVRVWEYMARDCQSRQALFAALCAHFDAPVSYAEAAEGPGPDTRHGAMYCPLAIRALVARVPMAAPGAFCLRVRDAADEITCLCWSGGPRTPVKLDTPPAREEDLPVVDAGVLFLALMGVQSAAAQLPQCILTAFCASYPPCRTLLWEQY